jgi:hypothetical protein
LHWSLNDWIGDSTILLQRWSLWKWTYPWSFNWDKGLWITRRNRHFRLPILKYEWKLRSNWLQNYWDG